MLLVDVMMLQVLVLPPWQPLAPVMDGLDRNLLSVTTYTCHFDTAVGAESSATPFWRCEDAQGLFDKAVCIQSQVWQCTVTNQMSVKMNFYRLFL